MKRLMRRPWVQALLGWLLWVVLVITRRSVRWRHDNVACAAEALKDDAPCIVLFWHGRIPLALGIAQVWWVRNKLRCMISPSSDGEFIAQALSRARFPAIRMSSAKAGDKEKMRAAVAGMREAIGWVKGGGLLAITPDGPRGPNEVIAPGALQIARRAGAPIYLIGVAADPAWRLDTWDKVMFARPFGRGATAWDGPFHVPDDLDEASAQRLIAELSSRLSALTRRAEDLACRPSGET
ncbi:MAG: lysophospholipid acyltransferase family protein [Phenylobacterium sp.]|uniref:lysophospholipid acyltransferase family protein n=1 Tax=Phenylobacterium sp. TaxID=1871053 RepID=UPI00391A4814